MSNLPSYSREHAGRHLGNALEHYRNLKNLVILAISPGGVVLAREIMQRMNAIMDIIVVCKLACPQSSGMAFGAIVSNGNQFLDPQVIDELRINQNVMTAVCGRELATLKILEQRYRTNRPWPILNQKTVILVDDEISSGETMHAAIISIRKSNPAAIVIAVPVASMQALEKFRILADEIITLEIQDHFVSIEHHCPQFSPVSEQQVCDLLVA